MLPSYSRASHGAKETTVNKKMLAVYPLTENKAREIHATLLEWKIVRVMAYTLTAINVVGDVDEADYWLKKMFELGLLREIPESGRRVGDLMSLAQTYDLVLADGTVNPPPPPKPPRRDRTKSLGPPQKADTTIRAIEKSWLELVTKQWKISWSVAEWVYVATQGKMFYSQAIGNIPDKQRPRTITPQHIRIVIRDHTKKGTLERDHVCVRANYGTAFAWNNPPTKQADTLLSLLLAQITDA